MVRMLGLGVEGRGVGLAVSEPCASCAHHVDKECMLGKEPTVQLFADSGGRYVCSEHKLLTRAPKNDIISLELRAFLMRKRQTLIMELGALEDLLKIERSIPKRIR